MRQPPMALCVLSAVILWSSCQKEDPPPKPVISSVAPVEGLTPGGLDITLKGEFFDKASEVKFGGTAGTDLRVVDGNTIMVKTPVHARGPVAVEVTTPGGTSSLDAAFKYLQPVTFTSLEPGNVVALATTSVILRGNGLVAPVTVTLGEAASAVTITARPGNDTAIPVDIPSLQPGTYTVRVTNADLQSATGTSPLIVDPAPLPVVGMVIPNQGPEAGGTNVRIQGQNFTGATLVRFGTAVAVNPVVNAAGTEIVVSTPQAVRARVAVEVSTPSGVGTLPNAFRYVRPVAVTSVTPSQVPANTPDSVVTVVGSGLVPPVSARLSDGVSNPIDLVVNPQNETTVAVHIPSMPANDYSLTLINADQQTGAAPGSILVRMGLQVDGVFPNVGFTDETTPIEITGPDLRGVTDVLLGTAPCTGLVLLTRTRIQCTAPASSTAQVDVFVRIGDTFEGRVTNGFEWVSPLDSAVRLVNVLPASGPATGNVSVDVGVTGVMVGDTPQVTFAGVAGTVTGRSSRSLSVTVPPRALSAGSLSVRVPVALSVNASSDVQDGAFLYFAPATISSITPNKGASVGFDEVTIRGTAFTAEQLKVFFDGAEATSVTRISETELTCRIPPHALGTATVTVHNEFGAGTPAPAAFEFVDAVRITLLEPVVFSTAGGAIVEATGSGFAAGRMSLTIVETNTPVPNITVLSPTRFRFVTPPHVAAPRITLRLQDTARVGQPFSSGDGVAQYVDATDPSGAARGGDILRNISVSVVRDDTKQRLANATVFVGNTWSGAMYKGVTNAEGMLVLAGLELDGPVTLTASLAGHANETIVGLDASFVTFSLQPRVRQMPAQTLAEVSGTITNWAAAGYPTGGAANRYKRVAAIFPSEPRIGVLPPIPGDAMILTETPCDITRDGVTNPPSNQFTVRTPVGKTVALMAVVYFYDSIDGNCNPDTETTEAPFAFGGGAMGFLLGVTPSAGSNPGKNITLTASVATQINVNFSGAPIAVGAPVTARTVDAFMDLGESGIYTFVNPPNTQGTTGFGDVRAQSTYFLLPAAVSALAGVSTGIPIVENVSYTLRAINAFPVMEGNQLVGYTPPLTEVFERNATGSDITVSGFYEFPSGLTPASGAQLGADRRFSWSALSRTEGLVSIDLERFAGIDEQGTPIMQPVWSVLMPAGTTSVVLPTVTPAPGAVDVVRTDVNQWLLRGVSFQPEDGFSYNERSNTIFERGHWRAHVQTAGTPFTIPSGG